MLLRQYAETDRMLRALHAQGFTEFEGKQLEKLSFNELNRAYVRLPELRQVEEVES